MGWLMSKEKEMNSAAYAFFLLEVLTVQLIGIWNMKLDTVFL